MFFKVNHYNLSVMLCKFSQAYQKKGVVHLGEHTASWPLLESNLHISDPVVVNKEGGTRWGLTVCSSVENPDVVFKETGHSQNLTHSRSPERGSRQAIQARPYHPDRMVSPSRGFSADMQPVAPTSDRPVSTKFNNKLLLFISPVPDPFTRQSMHSAYLGWIWIHILSHQ